MPYLDKTSGKYRATKMINGFRRTKSFKTKADAKKWEAQQSEESWIAEQQATASTSLLEWSIEYLDYSKHTHRPKTYKEEKVEAFNRLFEVMDPQSSVDDLTVTDALRLLEKRARDCSGNAANKDRKNLAAAWAWGSKYLGMPKDNPFADVDKFPEVEHPRYMPPESDFWKIYDEAQGEDKTLLLTYLHTGGRKMEILKLKWDDIDLDNKTVRLWTRKRQDGSLQFDLIPLTAQLAEALADHAKSKRGEYVFCHEDGKPFTDRGHFIPRLCEKAGVPRFNYHGIRHLTASILAKAGFDMPTIQALLRHKNVMTTTRYVHNLGFKINPFDKAFSR